MKELVPFCMRCFGISAVTVDENTNFCHNCGSEGTCITMERKDADYLRGNIICAVSKAEREKINKKENDKNE